MSSNLGRHRGSFRLDVATAPNDGLNPSVILTVKGIIPSQYLFNVPEGFSRFVLEHKLRPGLGLRGVFLTGLGHECHGLPGLLMRLRGEGHGAFELFGPRDSVTYVEALTHVCFWKNPSVLVSEIDPKPSADAMYEDENIIVHPIVRDFHDSCFQESTYDKAMVLSQLSRLAPSPSSTEHCIFNRCYDRLENSRQGNIWARQKASSVCTKKTILGYLCVLKETKDMILVSGLLDSVDQIKELVQHPVVLQCSTDTSKRCLTVISSPFTKEEIMDAACLEEDGGLMSRDSTDTVVLVNTVASACRHPSILADHRLGFDSTAKVSSKLNAICPYMFPLPFAWKPLLKGERMNCNGHGADGKIFGPISQAIYVQSDDMQCVKYESSDSIDNLRDLKDNQRLRDSIDISALRCLQDETKTLMQASFKGQKTSNLSAAQVLKDRMLKRKRNSDTMAETSDDGGVFADMISGPCVTFFGTGSAEPSKYRGPSGILVDVPGMVGEAYVLLDCGEGTFGQMVRLYGFQGARDRISKLKLIWISHRHADHMSGLAELLSMRPKDSEEVLIQGPKSCIRWMLGLKKLVDFPAFRIEHVSDVDSSACKRMLKQIGGATIQCTPVRHCADAYAVSFVFSDSFKLVYSGDTEPCDNLVRDGEGADLLIHEATFEPEMIQDARRKRHSTLEEAVDVSHRMNASRTLLTHFSQRYPKFPTGFPQKGSKVGIAFDGFCLPLKLIDSFPKYMTFFQQMLTHRED
ncbi:hypothetical protein M9434_001001 [Picochlorum sp. BPE23]|nr:hypothetical protein M9434_001001 [Picochlorum sp. BPE23]